MADPEQEEEIREHLKMHHDQAFGWALSCCRWERTSAEDILHTAYLKVLDGRAVFGGRSSFKTWLFEVIRRTAADHWRRKALVRLVPLGGMGSHLPSRAPDPEGDLLLSERNRALRGALSQLPDRQRQTLHLVFYAGLTIREAAEVLGISLGSARTHYERGKKRLKGLLEPEMSEATR